MDVARAAKLHAADTGTMVFNVSSTPKPHNRCTSQNMLEFTCSTHIPPEAMAITHSSGLMPKLGRKEAHTAAAVVKATVVEPVAVTRAAEMNQGRITPGRPRPLIAWLMITPMSEDLITDP